jgi:hypothetical protein
MSASTSVIWPGFRWTEHGGDRLSHDPSWQLFQRRSLRSFTSEEISMDNNGVHDVLRGHVTNKHERLAMS